MDVSEVKVLARRANGILFVAPVFILLSGFSLVYSILVLNNVIVPDKDILWVIYMFSFSGYSRYSLTVLADIIAKLSGLIVHGIWNMFII